jgi:hypothetical protein
MKKAEMSFYKLVNLGFGVFGFFGVFGGFGVSPKIPPCLRKYRTNTGKYKPFGGKEEKNVKIPAWNNSSRTRRERAYPGQ